MSAATCHASCSGYSSLRPQCVENPCYADNLCQMDDPSITDCAAWCCESRAGYMFLTIFLLGLGVFLLLAAHYTKRLHEENLQAGAVTVDGKVVTGEPLDASPQPTKRLRAMFTSKGGSLTPAR